MVIMFDFSLKLFMLDLKQQNGDEENVEGIKVVSFKEGILELVYAAPQFRLWEYEHTCAPKCWV